MDDIKYLQLKNLDRTSSFNWNIVEEQILERLRSLFPEEYKEPKVSKEELRKEYWPFLEKDKSYTIGKIKFKGEIMKQPEDANEKYLGKFNLNFKKEGFFSEWNMDLSPNDFGLILWGIGALKIIFKLAKMEEHEVMSLIKEFEKRLDDFSENISEKE